jgi:Cu+-exporting ATPase
MNQSHTLEVQGMTCASCANAVTKTLQRRGLSNISVNHASGEVRFDTGDAIPLEPVYDAIDGLGYRTLRPGLEVGLETDDHEGHDHGTLADTLLPWCIALTIPLLAHMVSGWWLLHNVWFQLALATPVFIMGWLVFGRSSIQSLRNGWPNMNVLILLGATAAYGYSLRSLVGSAHQFMFFETTASIITLVMLGNWLEHRTVKATTKSIDALTKLQPQTARLVQVDSLGRESVMEVEAKYLRTDDLVRVAEGEAIPVDGVVETGDLQVDEKMLTGEALPAHRVRGEAVTGGTLVVSGSALVRTTRVGKASTLSRIVELVRQAQATKPPLQKLADKISGIFVPAVLGISVLTLVINYFIGGHPFGESMSRAIAVLVISCPCAMGLATPAAVAVGLGRAARMGILVKGGDTLERIKKIRTIVFDKTGTLTTGNLQIAATQFSGISEAELKDIVVSLEKHSAHPIAKSILAQWSAGTVQDYSGIEEIKGHGMQGFRNGALWKLGKRSWAAPTAGPEDYDLYLSEDGQYRGALKLEDELRPDAAETIRTLKAQGYETVLISGDRQEKSASVAEQVGIETVYAGQTPEGKAQLLDELLQKGGVAMVGDGINDAPSLAKATVGISLSDASQIAVQSAQIILSGNKLSRLPHALKLGIYTERTIKSNLFWAFIYNVIAIPVAAAGYLSPTWGAGVMALSDVVLVLNSLYLGVRRLS